MSTEPTSTPAPDTQPPLSRPQRNGQRSQREWLIYALVIVLGLAVTLAFGLRLLSAGHRLREVRPASPPTGVAAIAEWMTLPHVARIGRVPEEYLWETLELSSQGRRPRSLAQLQANRLARDPQADPIIPLLQRAIATFHASDPQPLPAPNHWDPPRP